ncbi:MAG: hypothetical protein IPK19_21500 [Chloroflexi bacterium]|nr:hypothetical protein [Chloroflexota bacterium]
MFASHGGFNSICISLTLGWIRSRRFPFYTYDPDGSNPAREHHRSGAGPVPHEKYGDDQISKWVIFYYVYALLHSPSTARICRQPPSAICRASLPTRIATPSPAPAASWPPCTSTTRRSRPIRWTSPGSRANR